MLKAQSPRGEGNENDAKKVDICMQRVGLLPSDDLVEEGSS